MKIDSRHRDRWRTCWVTMCLVLACVGRFSAAAAGDGSTWATDRTETPPAADANSALGAHGAADSSRHPAAAREWIERSIEQLAFGAAFDAKIRQRVWVSGREVVGVGTYEQAGQGSGCFNLQLTMHDGDGKHTLQQVSDGRLAWTRQGIGDSVSLRRVDVGRLDQWVQDDRREARSRGEATPTATGSAMRSSLAAGVRPSIRVGGLTEMLDRIVQDHSLSLASGHLESREVWILTGHLNADARQRWNLPVESDAAATPLPELVPTRVVVALAQSNEAETGFGRWLPIRIEYWSDPLQVKQARASGPRQDTDESAQTAGTQKMATTPAAQSRLISLLELYSIRPITAPPIGRFRFDNQDAEVNFINETDRYLSRYGIRLTERQSRTLRR